MHTEQERDQGELVKLPDSSNMMYVHTYTHARCLEEKRHTLHYRNMCLGTKKTCRHNRKRYNGNAFRRGSPPKSESQKPPPCAGRIIFKRIFYALCTRQTPGRGALSSPQTHPLPLAHSKVKRIFEHLRSSHGETDAASQVNALTHLACGNGVNSAPAPCEDPFTEGERVSS